MLTCTKRYENIPFAHRAPNHDGHCRLIHGHNWTFDITFAAAERDANGFVMDFGKLKELRAELNKFFDHKLVLNVGDPLLQDFLTFCMKRDIMNVVTLDDCSCEGIALFVHQLANSHVEEQTDGRVRVYCVTVWEDGKNKATYASE